MRITNTALKARLTALVQHGYCHSCKENHNGAMVVVSPYIYCANCHSQNP